MKKNKLSGPATKYLKTDSFGSALKNPTGKVVSSHLTGTTPKKNKLKKVSLA